MTWLIRNRKGTATKLWLLPILSCALLTNVAAQALDTTDYFPLKVGNAWTYFSFEQAPYYYLALRSITGTQSFGDTLYSVFNNNLYTYYRKDSLGNVYVRIDTLDELLYKITADIGDSWKVIRRFNNSTINYTVTLIQRSEETVTLAGVFHGCMRFLFQTTEATEGTYYVWLAPGVGEVRRDAFGLGINYVLKRGEINNTTISSHVFHVFSTTPKSEENHVDTTSNITFFLNTIPPESIPDSDIVVLSQRQGILQGKLQKSSDAWFFLWTPERNFRELDTITVTLSARIVDAFGDSLDGNFDWNYEGSPKDDYTWRFLTGLVSAVHYSLPAPTTFRVSQNYPNPFNSTTILQYSIPTDGFVRIQVYNLLGQKVRTLLFQEQCRGHHQVLWDAKDDRGTIVGSGLYLIQVAWNGKNQIIRVAYLK